MDDFEDGFAVMLECFQVISLARAAGQRQLADAFYAVAVEWFSSQRARWPWVPSLAS